MARRPLTFLLRAQKKSKQKKKAPPRAAATGLSDVSELGPYEACRGLRQSDTFRCPIKPSALKRPRGPRVKERRRVGLAVFCLGRHPRAGGDPGLGYFYSTFVSKNPMSRL